MTHDHPSPIPETVYSLVLVSALLECFALLGSPQSLPSDAFSTDGICLMRTTCLLLGAYWLGETKTRQTWWSLLAVAALTWPPLAWSEALEGSDWSVGLLGGIIPLGLAALVLSLSQSRFGCSSDKNKPLGRFKPNGKNLAAILIFMLLISVGLGVFGHIEGGLNAQLRGQTWPWLPALALLLALGLEHLTQRSPKSEETQ